MFCYNYMVIFLGMVIFFIVETKILNFSQRNLISFWMLCVWAVGGAIGASMVGLEQYKKYAIKVMNEEIIKEEIISEVQKIMKKKHWSVKKKDDDEIIFKSSLFKALWQEYVTLTISENSVELTGPRVFVESIVKKLKKEGYYVK